MRKSKGLNGSSKKIKKSGNKREVEIKIERFEDDKKKIHIPQYILTIDDLMQFIKNRNENYATVQVCDENGEFFIIDRNTENILEKGKEVLKKMTLFELMTPISIQQIKQNSTNQAILRRSEEQNVFSYIIYSPNARKKILKYLNTGINSKQKTTG